MDGRSWSRRGAVRREDQFTAAPDFYDEHDSDHLPAAGRLAATWHGMGPARQVLVAASLLVVAGAAAAILIAWAAQTGPASHQAPAGASEGGPSLPSPGATVPSVPGNLTASASGSSTPPLLPPPSLPPPSPY